jgi:glycosyltransferase involved in cell wall biosynthesis
MVTSPAEEPRLLLLGDARQVHLHRWARYFIDERWDVLAFSLEESDRFPAPIRFARVTTAIPHAARYLLCAPLVRRLVRSFRPHVINAHFLPNYGALAALAGRRPWVLSTWGSDVMTNPDRSVFHRWRAARILRHAAYVTSDAETMSERIRSFGVPADRILTFPLGVDTSVFHPGAEDDAPGPRILSNRKLEPVYGVSTLLDAFPGIHEAQPQSTLTVAGDGSERRYLMQRAACSIGSGAIVFVGAVDHARMPGLLRENHLYVSMSHSDTTSVSLLEAMACGLFPIVSDIPANREWIEHGRNGMLVPPGQPMRLALAVVEAWRDGDLRRRALQANARIVRERAQWSENMRAARELFGRLAGEMTG